MPKTLTKANRAKLNQYRELLEEKARVFREGMSTPTAQVVARSEEPNDYGDLSSQSHEEWLFLNRNAAVADQVHLIEEALERLEEGSYGVCAQCEKPISAKRLQAVPWAKYCVPCQEQRGNWRN